jgi:hypothetical protein
VPGRYTRSFTGRGKGGRPEAHLSARFRAMLGAVLQSALASAPSAVQYDGVQREARASVIEGNDWGCWK